MAIDYTEFLKEMQDKVANVMSMPYAMLQPDHTASIIKLPTKRAYCELCRLGIDHNHKEDE